MSSLLTTLSEEKLAARMPMMGRDAMIWLSDKVAELKNPRTVINGIKKERDRYANFNDRRQFLIGGLYFFAYDPKGKRDLPYYDTFPLVMPLKKEADGFLGLNFHYLPLSYRIQLMKKMLPLATYDGDDIRRIRISYEILSASTRYREFRPCIKKYILPQIRSKILKVGPNEWDTALFLPVHQFRKAPTQSVWTDSVREVRE